jgi:hypothetical protein
MIKPMVALRAERGCALLMPIQAPIKRTTQEARDTLCNRRRSPIGTGCGQGAGVSRAREVTDEAAGVAAPSWSCPSALSWPVPRPEGSRDAAATGANTRDFRCLWRSGVLPLWCSVLVLGSGFVVRPPECRHGFSPRAAAGIARGSTVRGPGGRGGLSFLRGSGCGRGLREAGREYGDLWFPGDGLLGRGGVREFGAGFLGAF